MTEEVLQNKRVTTISFARNFNTKLLQKWAKKQYKISAKSLTALLNLLIVF
jgi:hypothetical protein